MCLVDVTKEQYSPINSEELVFTLFNSVLDRDVLKLTLALVTLDGSKYLWLDAGLCPAFCWLSWLRCVCYCFFLAAKLISYQLII